MPLIEIVGHADPVDANSGETILSAMIRNYDGIPYSCQTGSCGTCKCEYLGGAITEMDYAKDALSRSERAQNLVLMCRTRVWGNVRIRFTDEVFD